MQVLDGQIGLFDQDSWFGKMFQGSSQAEPQGEQTSQPSSKKSLKSVNREPMCVSVSRITDGQRPGATTLRMESGRLLGDYTMHSFGEQPSSLMEECSFPALPNGVSVSRLSQILEDSPPRKYCLSARACEGILRRAEKRGKELPKELHDALVNQCRDPQN